MKNPYNMTRSGASQASTQRPAENEHGSEQSPRHRSTGTSFGSEGMDDPAQPHTAGGTSSDRPRRVDNQ